MDLSSWSEALTTKSGGAQPLAWKPDPAPAPCNPVHRTPYRSCGASHSPWSCSIDQVVRAAWCLIQVGWMEVTWGPWRLIPADGSSMGPQSLIPAGWGRHGACFSLWTSPSPFIRPILCYCEKGKQLYHQQPCSQVGAAVGAGIFTKFSAARFNALCPVCMPRGFGVWASEVDVALHWRGPGL